MDESPVNILVRPNIIEKSTYSRARKRCVATTIFLTGYFASHFPIWLTQIILNKKIYTIRPIIIIYAPKCMFLGKMNQLGWFLNMPACSLLYSESQKSVPINTIILHFTEKWST